MARGILIVLLSLTMLTGCISLTDDSDADTTYRAFFTENDDISVDFEDKTFSSGDTVRLTATSPKYDLSKGGIFTYLCDSSGENIDTSHNAFDCELMSVSGYSATFEIRDATGDFTVVFIEPELRSMEPVDPSVVPEEVTDKEDSGFLISVFVFVISLILFASLFYNFRVTGNREERA